ncbi:hypothetical protein Taro_024542 [Colocasia esculenta]|uniref:Uncharacterized protein n=1 Tax=Colocasia esculenta TaxID=4460 RepID=A0A843VET8_COLES|nr:hypothetical protein [Colocasia esculenta]
MCLRGRGSVRVDDCTRVTDSGVEGKMVVRTAASSRLQSSLGWFGTPRMAGCQPVLLLTGSLFMALEPFREARHGTIVQPDYGGYYCVL